MDSTLSQKVVLSQVGDKVKIAYEDGGSGFVNLNYFDNLSINIDKTERQIQKENSHIALQKEKVVNNTEKKGLM